MRKAKKQKRVYQQPMKRASMLRFRSIVALMLCLCVVLSGYSGMFTFADDVDKATASDAQPKTISGSVSENTGISTYADNSVAIVEHDGTIKEYSSLQEAIDASENGDEIQLVQDVAENVTSEEKTFKLNMMDYTISPAEGSTKSVFTINGGKVELRNGTITGGNSSGNGGGISAQGAEVILSSMYITDNKASNYGGGIYLSNSTLTAAYTVISGNATTAASSFYSYGGGIYAVSSSVVTFNNGCSVEENKAKRGSGIYFSGSKLTAKPQIEAAGKSEEELAEELEKNGLVFYKNTDDNNSYGSAIYLAGGKVELEYTKFVENKNNASAGISAMTLWGADLTATNCRFEKNTAGKSIIYLSSGNADFTGCTVSDNKTTSGSTIYDTMDVVFTDCRIENNVAIGGTYQYCAGGLEIYNERADYGLELKVSLKNTVITGNRGSATGGILAQADYDWDNLTTAKNVILIMEGGAVYGNYATVSSAYYGNANDLWIPPDIKEVQIPAASEMSDKDVTFPGTYTWNDTFHGDISLEGKLTTAVLEANQNKLVNHYKVYYLTAGLPGRYVATTDSDKYETITEAVEESVKDGREITLIAGESDYTGNIITENVNIPASADIVINMNDRVVQSKTGSTFEVAEGASLTLVGPGTVRTLGADGAYGIVNNGSLMLSGDVQVETVRLGNGKYITAGEDFAPDALTIILDQSVLASLNSTEENLNPEPVVTLIEGKNLTEDLAEKITVQGANGLVEIVKAGDKIVARRLKLTDCVFLDGKNGDNSNDGLTRKTPVETFDKAKEILEEHEWEKIYIINTVSVTQDDEWSLEGASLVRDPLFKGTLINVSGSLTLSDITIDGSRKFVEASAPLVEVTGTLTMTNGAVVKNNKNTITTGSGYGGAVLINGAKAKLIMEGGEISNSTAWHGGGVLVENGGHMTMSGGTISGNTTEGKLDRNSTDNSGGGVALITGATMTLEDGTISGNRARTGAGISVGGGNTVTAHKGGKLTMTGGTVSGNVSDAEGGGIIVQSRSTAEISGGFITDNTSSSGQFGGGGIYINGERSIDGTVYRAGVLHLYNAEITDNTAGRYGGGYAGCETSITNIFETNGSAIYNNSSSEGKNDIYISYVLIDQGHPEYLISHCMYDGTPYLWEHSDGRGPLSASDYQGSNVTRSIYTPNKPEKPGAVVISGNKAAENGGGIGTNGTVYVGEDINRDTEISVTKNWDDEENKYNTRPESVIIWLLRDGERIARQTMKRQEDGTWPTIYFRNLQEEYVYTVEEEMPEEVADIYTGIVTGDAESGFTITNKLIRELVIRKTTVNEMVSATQGKTFTFTVQLKNDDGTPFEGILPYVKGEENGILTFEDGKAEVQLASGESVTIQELPVGVDYVVTEEESGGYTAEITVDGVKQDTASGKTKIGRIEVEFTNTYSSYGEVYFTVTKKLDGRAWKADDVFEFTLTQVDDNEELPDLPETIQITGKDVAGTEGSVTASFSGISFDKEGFYEFEVAEVQGSIEGIKYDTTKYTVTVDVKDNGDGTMALTITGNDELLFTNVYEEPTEPEEPTTTPEETTTSNTPETTTNPGGVTGTGDNSPIVFYVLLALLTLSIMCLIFITKKEYREQ